MLAFLMLQLHFLFSAGITHRRCARLLIDQVRNLLGGPLVAPGNTTRFISVYTLSFQEIVKVRNPPVFRFYQKFWPLHLHKRRKCIMLKLEMLATPSQFHQISCPGRYLDSIAIFGQRWIQLESRQFPYLPASQLTTKLTNDDTNQDSRNSPETKSKQSICIQYETYGYHALVT